MATNFTPTNANQVNNHDTTQMDPPEHLTWDHEYPPKGHFPCSQLIITHYTLFMVLNWTTI